MEVGGCPPGKIMVKYHCVILENLEESKIQIRRFSILCITFLLSQDLPGLCPLTFIDIACTTSREL